MKYFFISLLAYTFLLACAAATDRHCNVQLVSSENGTGATLLLNCEDAQLFKLNLINPADSNAVDTIDSEPIAFENTSNIKTNDLLTALISHIKQEASHSEITPELFCGMISITSSYPLRNDTLQRFTLYLLDLLITKKLKYEDISSYLEDHKMKHQSKLAKMMILELIKLAGVACDISNGVMRLGDPFIRNKYACIDFRICNLDMITNITIDGNILINGDYTDEYLESTDFNSMYIYRALTANIETDSDVKNMQIEMKALSDRRENLLIELHTVDETKSKEAIENYELNLKNEISEITKEMDVLMEKASEKLEELKEKKGHLMSLINFMFDLIPSKDNRIVFTLESVCSEKSLDIFDFTATRSLDNPINLDVSLDSCNNVVETIEMMSRAMIGCVKEFLPIEDVRVHFYAMPRRNYGDFFDALGPSSVEVVKLHNLSFKDLIEDVEELAGRKIRCISLNIFKASDMRITPENIRDLKLALSNIIGLEGIDFRFKMANGLIELVKELGLECVGIEIDCAQHELKELFHFISAVFESEDVKTVVIYNASTRINSKVFDNEFLRILASLEVERTAQIIHIVCSSNIISAFKKHNNPIELD